VAQVFSLDGLVGMMATTSLRVLVVEDNEAHGYARALLPLLAPASHEGQSCLPVSSMSITTGSLRFS
jgi:hypothetical protein